MPPVTQLETLMKIVIAAAGLMALLPAAAQAQDREVREERRIVIAGPGHRMEIGDEGITREAFMARHAEAFAAMDSNGDGRVTPDEMRAHHEAMAPEIFALRGDHPGPGPGDIVIRRRGADGADGDVLMFQRRLDGPPHPMAHGDGEIRIVEFRDGGQGRGLDADGDGRLTFEELAAPLRRHFAEMDANGDGVVDESERGPGLRRRAAD